MLFPRGGDLRICGGDVCILGAYEYVVWLPLDGGEEDGIFPHGGVTNGEPLPQEEEGKGSTLYLRGKSESRKVYPLL